MPLSMSGHHVGHQAHHSLDSVPLAGSDYIEQISYGCKLVQDACGRKVQDLEKELENLKREAVELRRQSDVLRDRNMQLESELLKERKKAQEQLEENRTVATQATTLRSSLSKLGKFRDTLGDAFQVLDTDMSGSLDRTEYSRARAELGLRSDFAGADANHDGKVSRQEFGSAAGAARPTYAGGGGYGGGQAYGGGGGYGGRL